MVWNQEEFYGNFDLFIPKMSNKENISSGVHWVFYFTNFSYIYTIRGTKQNNSDLKDIII